MTELSPQTAARLLALGAATVYEAQGQRGRSPSRSRRSTPVSVSSVGR
ncbi:hypothetical protein [Branchiibius cervicis]|uniref:Uncharacterized protein n=1 Tax=Branchiibius cervicis TaxID=908252 RepID=A0ABW2APV8_9MICO